MNRIRTLVNKVGLAPIIIGALLLLMFVLAPSVGLRIDQSLTDTVVRFGMNGIMVLGMIPMLQTGCGLNFGLPVGIIAGLLGSTLSIEMGLTGNLGFLCAIGIAMVFSAIFGWAYGKLLNRVKGYEMMIATYVGFSAVALMNIMWMVLPYKSPKMVWGFLGAGLRTTISLDGFWSKNLDNALAIRIGSSFMFPTGTIIFFVFMALFMWAFFHTKTGTAMTAVGSNPDYARASGISIDKMRTISVIMSTMYGAIGILIFQQSFGFIQLYNAPFYMALPAVAAILIGGASVNKATISNAVIGTFLFQGLLTMTPAVINAAIQSDISDVVRIIVSDGMILYALTRVTRKSR